MYEIERKFLVTLPVEAILANGADVREYWIEQVYLRDTGKWAIRSRRTTDLSTGKVERELTMKFSVSDRKQYEIPLALAESEATVLEEVGYPVISKKRYDILAAGSRWHIDVFSLDDTRYAGLIIAEIELKTETQDFDTPVWLGEEITSDPMYRNICIARHLAGVVDTW